MKILVALFFVPTSRKQLPTALCLNGTAQFSSCGRTWVWIPLPKFLLAHTPKRARKQLIAILGSFLIDKLHTQRVLNLQLYPEVQFEPQLIGS